MNLAWLSKMTIGKFSPASTPLEGRLHNLCLGATDGGLLI